MEYRNRTTRRLCLSCLLMKALRRIRVPGDPKDWMTKLRGERSVGRWLVGVDLDSAGAIRAVSSELDVALVTPGGVPGVLNEPVVLAVLGAVSNGEHGVIEVGSALGAGEDTGVVGLEDHLVGLDGDGKRLGVKSSHHLGWVGWGDVDV